MFGTMKCKNCGKEIPDDSKFCTFCGGKIIKQQSFLKMYYAQIRDVLFLSVFIPNRSLGFLCVVRQREIL